MSEITIFQDDEDFRVHYAILNKISVDNKRRNRYIKNLCSKIEHPDHITIETVSNEFIKIRKCRNCEKNFSIEKSRGKLECKYHPSQCWDLYYECCGRKKIRNINNGCFKCDHTDKINKKHTSIPFSAIFLKYCDLPPYENIISIHKFIDVSGDLDIYISYIKVISME